MVQINFAQKQVNAKIVYYGPGMSGKTTNLEVIHQRAPEGNRGDLTSISTDGDRTLFFDFMPLDLGTVAGMRTCFQVYTVPGQVYYNSTRKLVLQGVDGVIFVADSSPDMMEENLESMRNLAENLAEYGRSAEEIPLVIQYNKRDIPGALPIAELEEQLNQRGVPAFEGVANTGQGVFPTLKALASCVLESLHKQSGSASPAPPPPTASPAPPPPVAAAPQQPVQAPPAPVPAASAPAPPAPPAPLPGAQTEDRQTISMSQTGFHKAPSLPLQGAASEGTAPGATQQPQTPAMLDDGGLQMSGAPEPGGLQMAQPAPPSTPAPAEPGLAMAQPATPAPQSASAPAAVAAPPQPAPQTGAQPGGMVRPEPAARPTPRREPTSRSFPSRAKEVAPTPRSAGRSKSALVTTLIVVASIGVGAALGSFVLSML